MDGIDLFKEYIVDRERKFLHYDEHKRGFIVYSYPCRNHEECFIDDMFILDSERDLKLVKDLVRHVEAEARGHGKKYLTGAVNIKKPDADRLLKSYLWHQMKPIGTNGEFIYLGKEL